jgi:presenilin-like A22 family membrane protease
MRMFAIGAFTFMLAQIIGLLTGFINLSLPAFAETASIQASVGGFLIAFLVATTVLLLLIKFVKGNILFKIMLALLIFMGTDAVFETFMNPYIAMALAVFLVILRFVKPTVFVQNIVMTIAIAGIGATLGLMFPVGAIILILIILSVYDYIAIFKTKHMVKMFQSLVSRNVPLSIVIPGKLEHLGTDVKKAIPGKSSKGDRQFMMLGTGDIAFPVVFAVSAARHSLFSGVAVLFGAFFGLVAVYSILMKKQKGAIPALPPIALCTITTFLLSLIVEWLAVIL